MYARVHKDNLACFQISNGTDYENPDDYTWAHASVVQGSILHYYPRNKDDNGDSIANQTVRFYCPLANLVDGQLYKLKYDVGTGKLAGYTATLLSSSGEEIETLRWSTGYTVFTKSANMATLRFQAQATESTKVNMYLTKGTGNTGYPYLQKVQKLYGVDATDSVSGDVISGTKEPQFVFHGGGWNLSGTPRVVYSASIRVWYVGTSVSGHAPMLDYSPYVQFYGEDNWITANGITVYWFIPKSNSTVSSFFRNLNKGDDGHGVLTDYGVTAKCIVIPEGWQYEDIFSHLSSSGVVYVHESSPCLTSSAFYKRFIGWTMRLYDSGPTDVVCEKVITESTSYAY